VEEPDPDQGAELADLDLVTGRLNPMKLGPRTRSVYLPGQREGQAVDTDDDDDDDSDKTTASGEFKPCGVCRKTAGYGRSSVQDHQTKGDQPFQALIARQIEVQPPSRPYSDFAPLRGRKVLAFSDSRQVAARLAPNLQSYAMRDVIRPLIVRGWTELSKLPGMEKQLGLHFLVLATLVGAKRLSVRLRPELRQGESMAISKDVGRLIDAGALTGNEEARMELVTLPVNPPDSLMRAIYATLTDRYYGLAALGLASLREREADRAPLLEDLVDLPGVADTDEAKLALVRLWLAQWSLPSYGIWFPGMPADWRGVKGGVRPHAGKFRPFERWLGSSVTTKQFNKDWLPALQQRFCEAVDGGKKHYLLANRVALQTTDDWGYCERCRFTQRPFPGSIKCASCGAERVRTLDPNEDPVFRARKGYYRASTVRALNGEPPMSIIAAEHTAQLNAAQAEAVFSKAEEHELLFQDVDIELPNAGAQERAAIDVLSCTTTMEVGIDIGALSGVALRNMPPSRANYQQRAGRAGRRGNAVATVVAFGSSDTHDDHYFREPAEMIRGKVVDPVLTMDNDEIARRHVVAYLLQRYHQDRLPNFDPATQPSQLFEVLGTVPEFVGHVSPLNRRDFEAWLKVNAPGLRSDIDDWLPSELGESRDAVLDGIVTNTLESIDGALDLTPSGMEPEPAIGDLAPEGEEVEAEGPAEDGAEEPSPMRSQTNLLDRLLYKGVLPRYAFPTDVAGFHVFDLDRSEPFRAAFRYAPSQGLPVALSQYAPGKVVWIDNKEWRSGAIYSPVQAERYAAWQNHKLYFECRVCHYAKYYDQDLAYPGEIRECEACGTEDSFGEAMAWMRPPGFAHPAYEAEGTSPDDAPARSYATRAKLVAPGPEDASGAWSEVSNRIQQTYHRETLIVTNTGPRNEGYTYCFKCGRIEPTANPTGTIVGQHRKPFPDQNEQDCPGASSWKGLVLGTDFITDVLLVRLKVDSPVRLAPQLLSTQVALRTIAEAMTVAATQLLDIEATELQAEYRPALTPGGAAGLEAEIYLYDTLAGGAGFTRRVEELGIEVLEKTLERLEHCPADCDQSCYRCLRSFRNRFEHGLLDRKVGASLLRYLLYGTAPVLDADRLNLSTGRLFSDLVGRGLTGVVFERDAEVNIVGIGTVTAPILATKGDRRFIFGVHSPLTPHLSADEALNDATDNQAVIPVRLIDDIEISRSLPNASLEVERVRV
jgi:hypothetical protein